MNTLLIRDSSEVANSISKYLSAKDYITEIELSRVSKTETQTFDSVVISSHQFAYDKDMSKEELSNFYQTDLVEFSSFLDNVDKYIPNGGKIIIILSMDYINGSFASKHYNALHAARKSLIQSYGNTLAKKGISINGIALGWIEDVLETETDEDTEKIKNVAKKFNPFNRMGKPDEVAELVSSLLKIKTDFLNGHVINFDGGQINSDPVNKQEWELLIR